MEQPGIQAKVEALAELLVFAEPSDLKALADLHTGFQEAGALFEEGGQQEAVQAVNAAGGLLEAIILEEVDDAQATLDAVNRTVAALQCIARDGRPAAEIEFPEELGLGATAEEDASAGAASAVDASILSSFLARQPGVMEDFEALVLALEKGPDEDKLGQLRRLIHTLKGEAGMLGLPDVERLCHVSEDALQESAVDALSDRLLGVKDWLNATFESMAGKAGAAPGPVDPVIQSLQGYVEAGGAETEEEDGEGQALEGDPDLLGEFVSEAREHLENADMHLLTLETTPKEEEAMNAVFRAFHTIKGVAGFLALDEVQKLAHEAETLLDRARKGDLQLVGGFIDVTFEAVDMLKSMVDDVADALGSGGTLTPKKGLKALTGRLAAAAAGKAPEPSTAPRPAYAGQEPEPLGEILVETGGASEEAVDKALHTQCEPTPHEKLGELLLKASLISRSQLDQALELQAGEARGKPIGDVLIEMGAIGKENVVAFLNKQEAPEPPKVGELLVKSGDAKAKDVALALRAQRQQRQPPTEVKEAVKVDADRLDRLIDTIGELVIAESMVSQSDELQAIASPQVARHLNLLDKITRELQEMGMSLRMIPVRATFQKMARLVRDLAKKSGKKVNFVMAGEDTELDKSVVDRIGDPLVHMIRNSVDHGLEPDPQQRVAAGKSAEGRVVLRAFHKGGSIYIEVEDDGRGLNRDAILAKARERELIREGETLSDRDVWNLIFEPGFSTAKEITDVSGRGVGMDVVRRNIEALRGQVEIQSEKGVGTVFTIRLPLTLAIIDGMVVRVGDERYIVPTLSVVRSIRPESAEMFTVVKRGEVLSLQGQLIPLIRLHRLFAISGAEKDPTKALAVVVEDEGRQVGILVDELLGQQQIVIKSLGAGMRELPGISGGAIMTDGSVGLILDAGGIVKLANSENAHDATPGSESAARDE